MLKLKDFGVIREEAALSNGAKLILYKKSKSPISIRAVFLCGSRFDPVGKEGTSHFLEHMITAGSERFSSKDKLAAYIEQYGGEFSAFTSPDIMVVNVSVGDPKDLKYACEVFHEILMKPQFNEKTIETERGSILKELGNLKSNPSDALRDVWQKLFFQGTEAGRVIIGSEESIDTISKNDLIEFRNNYFTSGRLLFIASGDIEIDELKKSFENLLILPSSKPYSFSADLPIIRKQFIFIEPYEKIDQAHIMYGFRTPKILHSDELTLKVIAEALGGGRASVFKKRLRYEKGLVYDVSAWQISRGDYGSWVVKTSTSRNNVQEVLNIITNEIKRVMIDGLSSEEILFVKNKIIKSKLMEMQTSSSWVDFHARYELFNKGKAWTLEDYLRGIESVTSEDIIRVANKYFGADKWYLGICGDIKEDSIKISW